MPRDDDPNATFYCNCELCDWEKYVREEAQGEVIAVLHVLDKHPDDYFQATGNDPEVKRKEYAVELRAFRNLL
jgi:hypothetical protein